ncbi:MAG TPA: FAD-binding oxidoreductase [Nocardioidaceae bacterium]|nr:FAD-binding oxidoreductase [Nocardioidaceae bacterium]
MQPQDVQPQDGGPSYSDLSLWWDSVPGVRTPREPLPGDRDVDVAIVGGGYTGLWTAYYLTEADPTLRVAVVEKEVAGFGASGRNGGWCSALFPAPLSKVARMYGHDGAVALQRAMHGCVDEVGRVTAAEGIDCHYAKGGTVSVARTPAQLARARSAVREARSFGFGDDDLRLLEADETRQRFGATESVGATYTPHCAAIHPARLVRGLADVVERRGVGVYEQTEAQAVHAGVVQTSRGRLRAETVVRATEGYTARLPGSRRALVPVYSLMLATAPLPASTWGRIGLARRETFTDHRHLIIYGQRTADDRIAFGGRGAPYHFGSRIRPGYDRDARVFTELRRVLDELLPVVSDVPVTHTWGGPLGVPRDWFASVGIEPDRRFGWAGGYVGDGVGAANLAGRTMADLVTGRDTDAVRLPWVQHRSRSWEPEPLRWLGVNLARRLMTGADAAEERTGRSSRRAALLDRLLMS